jgi:predicted DNA-binding protein (UPF0251 family)
MAHPRTLTDEQLVACEWEWTNTKIGSNALGRKYGWGKTPIWNWMKRYGWKKAAVLKDYPDTPEGNAEFKKDLDAAVKLAYDRKLIGAIEDDLHNRRNKAEQTRTVPGAPFDHVTKKLPNPRGRPKKSKTEAPPAKPDQSVASAAGSPDNVTRFPGHYIPPPPELPRETIVPPRDKASQAAMRLELNMLRAEATLSQLKQLAEHDEVIADYRHLLAVCLNPNRFVDVRGLSQEKAEDKLIQVSRAALRQLLPTERDTLAGAVLALNKATLASIMTARQVLGIMQRGVRSPGLPTDVEPGAGDPAKQAQALGLDALRQVKHSMELLTGAEQAANEAPRPPPPEDLDDLVVNREDPPKE